jgi:hypothetical protein
MKFRELHGVLCGRKWSVKMKGRVYRACVRAAMVYGGETWVMRKEEECLMKCFSSPNSFSSLISKYFFITGGSNDKFKLFL